MANREIKFKYYWQHEETGRMMSRVCTLDEIGNGTVAVFERSIWNYGLIARCEWTGLVDKNGVEIFEFDKVLVPYNHIGIVTVEFKDGAFNITKYKYSACPVVGNVFEETKGKS